MTLFIVRLISYACEFVTHLNTNLNACRSNVLNLILFVDKGFAHMLART
jgi:hypothetical protein